MEALGGCLYSLRLGRRRGAPQGDQDHTRECGPHENVTVRDGKPPPTGLPRRVAGRPGCLEIRGGPPVTGHMESVWGELRGCPPSLYRGVALSPPSAWRRPERRGAPLEHGSLSVGGAA